MAKRQWWRWLVGSVAAGALLYFAGGTWAVHQLIVALLQVERVLPADPPATDTKALGFRGDPLAAFGLSFEDVEIATPLGPAPAWLIPAAGEARRTWAIYVHGIGGRREDGYRYLPILHEAGFPLLMITYRNDDGAPMTADGLHGYGVSEWPDLEAAVDFAKGLGATDVLLVGDSMGGAITGQFLAQSDRAVSVSAVILDSPALDFGERVTFALGKAGFAFAPVLTALAQQTVGLQRGLPIAEAVAIDQLAAFAWPVLLIHGTGDQVIPVSTGDRLLARRVGITTMLRTGADHLRTSADHLALFDATLRTFLDSLKTEAPR